MIDSHVRLNRLVYNDDVVSLITNFSRVNLRAELGLTKNQVFGFAIIDEIITDWGNHRVIGYFYNPKNFTNTKMYDISIDTHTKLCVASKKGKR